MRYSESRKAHIETPVARAQSNHQFVEAVARKAGRDALAFSILLVGGSDPLSIALRRAQAPLRFDVRASYWSHVAILAAPAVQLDQTRGLEVSLDPHDRTLQVPERNGVTEFTLQRYLDSDRYPNLALVTLEYPDGSRGRDAVVDALRHPNRDRERFPLWRSLSAWARYVYAAERTPSPLLEAIIMPCAGLCEYAFEAAGVDLTPGAVGNNTCPELLWSTVNHWQDRVANQAKLTAFALVRDEACSAHPALSMTLDLHAPKPPKAAPVAKSKRGRKS